ncbi:hypothetical protein FMM05_01385 [Flavobacterium zepuense]|uniref:MoxR-vWA-beta-propeller ternary system domain-containing protein n=1 Tax=Flavobacterium zepuense TaxID=2593302 RepID=A0A552VAD0_9FLAO|nr:hypothetical protein [Flavobacterium zepuense]TRW27320.1 hypothetical protein FMM05_01385 [Flavobacterium zepuense]
MAEDTANHITTYILEIPISNTLLLGHIRHWDNLKGATDDATIWIKDITQQQADSPEIMAIPYKTLYYQKDNLLFVKGSLLPVKKMRSALLWSPLDRLLPVSLPPLNHNFFGITNGVSVNIIPSATEQEPYALLLNRDAAASYITSAPKVRLQNLHYSGIDDNILILGTPLLPVSGQTYWRVNNMLLPAGYDFELPLLYSTVENLIAPDGNHLIIWQINGSYTLLPKEAVMPLSISSFRLTYPTA